MRDAHRQSALAVGLAALAAVVGNPPAATQESTPRARFAATMEARVVDVDVWVADADGRPVADLERRDFTLLIDGEEVEIRHFRGGPATDDASEPLLLLLVDNENITEAGRERALARLRAFLTGGEAPPARVLVASNDGSLVVHQEATTDRSEILAALAVVEAAATDAERHERERRNLLAEIAGARVEEEQGFTQVEDSRRPVTAGGDDVMGGHSFVDDVPETQGSLTDRGAGEARLMVSRIRSYGVERQARTRRALEVIDRLVGSAAALPGPKALLYVSEGLPQRSGEELWDAFSRRFRSLGSVSSRMAVEAEAAHGDAAELVSSVAAHASSSEVALHSLFAAEGVSRGRGPRGSPGAAAGDFSSWSDSVASIEDRNRLSPLVTMAEETGGRAGFGPAAFDAVLAGILSDSGHAYSLGYVPEPEDARPGERRVAVRLSRQGLRPRHRRTLRYESAEERMDEFVLSALLGASPPNPLELSLETRPPIPTVHGRELLLPVLVRVPLDRLRLLPERAEHLARLSMAIAVRDGSGRTSDVTRNRCHIRISNDQILEAFGRSITCGVRLALLPGHHEVAVTLRDGLAGVLSTVRLGVELQAPDDGRPQADG